MDDPLGPGLRIKDMAQKCIHNSILNIKKVEIRKFSYVTYFIFKLTIKIISLCDKNNLDNCPVKLINKS